MPTRSMILPRIGLSVNNPATINTIAAILRIIATKMNTIRRSGPISGIPSRKSAMSSSHSKCMMVYITSFNLEIACFLFWSDIVSVTEVRLTSSVRTYPQCGQDLAEKLHVSVSTVRSWEQGRSNPDNDTLVEICRYYQVSSDYLLGVSNVDPVYEQHRRSSKLTAEEQAELKRYEEFLLYKRRKRKNTR